MKIPTDEEIKKVCDNEYQSIGYDMEDYEKGFIDGVKWMIKYLKINSSLPSVVGQSEQLKAFVDEFIEAWEDGNGGDSDLYSKAKNINDKLITDE